MRVCFRGHWTIRSREWLAYSRGSLLVCADIRICKACKGRMNNAFPRLSDQCLLQLSTVMWAWVILKGQPSNALIICITCSTYSGFLCNSYPILIWSAAISCHTAQNSPSRETILSASENYWSHDATIYSVWLDKYRSSALFLAAPPSTQS